MLYTRPQLILFVTVLGAAGAGLPSATGVLTIRISSSDSSSSIESRRSRPMDDHPDPPPTVRVPRPRALTSHVAA